MTTYTESGIEVRLPDGQGFRFSECAAFQRLSGKHLKEMDFGWWDAPRSRVLLLEVKGREVWDEVWKRKDTSPTEHLVAVLERKAIDSLALLSAVWLQTHEGASISAEIPTEAHSFPGDGRLVLAFVLDTGVNDRALLSAARDRLNERLAGRLALVGTRNAIVADVEGAARAGLPVRSVS